MNGRSLVERVFLVGAPLALAVIEVFHPRVHDPVEMTDPGVWLTIHYLQLALFPLCALAVIRLARGLPGFSAALSRAAMFVFGVTYVAFDTAAGVVTGTLTQAARDRNVVADWKPAIDHVWRHSIVGGAPDTVPALAIVGTIAWLIGAIACAVTLRRAGSGWTPVVLLVVSALGLFVFRTHAWPGGPVTFGALAAAAALTRRESRLQLAARKGEEVW